MLIPSVVRRLLSHRLKLSALIAAMLALPHGASATSFRTIYSFCGHTGRCLDGEDPSSLTLGPHNHFFGTTSGGGSSNSAGTVFALSDTGKLQTLYRFCQTWPCNDGWSPTGLIVDVNGALYGITSIGGKGGNGVIFKLAPDQADGTWHYTLLHTFCAKTNCTDGGGPQASLSYQGAASGALYDGTSPLFGIAGGGANGAGVVYRLKFKNGAPDYSVIYDFCAQSGCADGTAAYALDRLKIDSMGNIYGAVLQGEYPYLVGGALFKLTPGDHRYTETVLYTFCQTDCADGWGPDSFVFDAVGNLFGTTRGGGAYNRGVALKLAPVGSTWQSSVLYSFCPTAPDHCWDGDFAPAPFVVGSGGTLYGTTEYGGDYYYDGGTIFALNGTTLSTLYVFCTTANCSDGKYPGALIQRGTSLYGTTREGGAHGRGSIFEFVP